MAEDYEIIDAHTHVHATAAAAADFLTGTGHTDWPRKGTAEEALRIMDAAGIKTTMILPWIFARQVFENEVPAEEREGSTAAARVKERIAAEWSRYNDWAIEVG